MGIQDLGTLLKNEKIDFRSERKLDMYHGKRIGIDVAGLSYPRNHAVIKSLTQEFSILEYRIDVDKQTKLWLSSMFHVVFSFLAAGILPVLLFDGKHKTAKEKTLEKRKAQREHYLRQKTELEAKLDAQSVVARDDEDIDKLRKVLCNLNFFHDQQAKTFRRLVRELGIPYVRANDEGEKIGASLYHEGKIAAILSKDTDLLALGCNDLLTEIRGFSRQPALSMRVEHASLEAILEGLELRHSEFVHLCIMLGCDFNQRVRGIGPVRALQHIREHRSLYKLPFDTQPLNIDHCIEFFSYTPSEYCAQYIKLEYTPTAHAETLLTEAGIDAMTQDMYRATDIVGIQTANQLLPEERKLPKVKRIYPPVTVVE